MPLYLVKWVHRGDRHLQLTVGDQTRQLRQHFRVGRRRRFLALDAEPLDGRGSR